MKNSTQKIADLITVPPVETVIQLSAADSKDPDRSRELLSSFVLTDEIEDAIRQLFTHVSDEKGVGAFVKGNYGSGKSHFLAVLSLLLESDRCWDYISHPLLQEFSGLRGQKRLVVKIALHNFASGEALETIVLEETEKALSDRIGKPVLLHRGALLVNHFNRYILPQHGEFLNSVNRTSESWEDLCKTNANEAAKMVHTFVQSHGIPLKAQFDRRQSMDTLSSVLEAEDFTGVFFAVDELSEFLKSKTDAAAFAEDLRFLQFMGEMTKELPFYLVATLQENIEQTGYLEDDLVHRIKDRFPFRFTLSSHHVKQLISKRLIRKKPGAEKAIKKVYDQFRGAFPKIAIDSKPFIEIYPVHPDTVTIMEGLTPLFSQHRGVVDFIYHQLTGDPNRKWEGMLSLPVTQLMTPDTIFDHFQERIKEHPELSAYSEVVFKTLDREIPTIFESTQDQQIAYKAIKILILIEISPIEKRPTVQKLAQMVDEPVSDLEESVNYRYLEEVILGKLVKEGSFVTRSVTDTGENVYHISLELTIHQMVRNRVQEVLKRPTQIHEEFLRLFPYLRSSMIPFSFLAGGQRKKYTIQWQNTNREGWVYFKSLLPVGSVELETIIQQVKISETDFVLFIGGIPEEGFPDQPPFGFSPQGPSEKGFFGESMEGRFAGAVLGWLPRPFREDESRFIHQFYAYLETFNHLGQNPSPQERQMRDILKEWIEEHENELVTVVENAYYGGRIADYSGWRPFRFSMLYPDFKALLKQFFSPILQRLYPRHSEIMPGDLIQPFAVEKLFAQFIRVGRISRDDARAQHLDTLIGAYLSPLAIVESTQTEYVLSVAFKDNSFGADVIGSCMGEKPMDLYSLYWQMRKSNWGVSRYQFQLLLGALIVSGRLTAFQSGNVTPFRAITQLTDGSVDAVGEGRLISEEIQEALLPFLTLSDFDGIPEHFSVSTQEQIWRRMKHFRETVSALLHKREVLASRYEAYPAYQSIIHASDVDLTGAEQFCQSIRVSYSAQQGLEKIAHEMGLERLCRLPTEVQGLLELISLFETRFSELNQIYVYLQHPSLTKVISNTTPEVQQSFQQLYRNLENGDFLPKGNVSDFTQQFYEFRTDHIGLYSKAHATYYSRDVFHASTTVESEPAVRLLKQFHSLESVVATPDWIAVQERILRLEEPCRHPLKQQLATLPICECGFIPGQELPESQAERIRDMAMEGVQSVLRQLQTAFRWAIEEYLVNLNRVGQTKTADRLTKLLNIPVEQVEKHFSRLTPLVTEELISAINSAIRGKVLILQRQVKMLTQRIAGRQMTLKEVRTLFDEWLMEGESIGEDTYIHILGDEELPEFDRRFYRRAEEIIREKGFRFFEAFWLLAWAGQHGKREWLDWVQNRYRIQSHDFSVVASVREELSNRDDADRMAIYLIRAQMTSRLMQLIGPQEMSLDELQDFVLNERFLEPLSLEAAKQLILRIAPTEPLTSESTPFLNRLRSHPKVERWSHLTLLERFLTAIDLITNGEAAENLMKYYLSGGWQLTHLLEEVKRMGSVVSISDTNRLDLLSDRGFQLQKQFVFSKERVGRKELPVPYFSIETFPKKLQQQIGKSPVVLLIVDAMRWDVWEGLRSWFEKNLTKHGIVYLGAMEVASPTTTEVNRPLLIQKLADVTGALEWHLETVSEDPANRAKVIGHLSTGGQLTVLNTTIVDTLLHERKEPFRSMLEVVKTRMDALMGPVLRAFPPQSTVVISADHGFVEQDGDYVHGGDSYFEKVVPFSVWHGEEAKFHESA
ncbi:MAG: hypothetical protein IIA61_02910 [Candidatus Marinimicrobia bacterium]|nr:hypothetical protein [Candidatus Neomarinimicrobiota bacterium]